MRKILITIIGIILCTGCSYTNHINDGEAIGVGARKLELVDITFNGGTHEYVLFRNCVSGHIEAMSPWEGCKYCKEKEHEHNCR